MFIDMFQVLHHLVCFYAAYLTVETYWLTYLIISLYTL